MELSLFSDVNDQARTLVSQSCGNWELLLAAEVRKARFVFSTAKALPELSAFEIAPRSGWVQCVSPGGRFNRLPESLLKTPPKTLPKTLPSTLQKRGHFSTVGTILIQEASENCKCSFFVENSEGFWGGFWEGFSEGFSEAY